MTKLTSLSSAQNITILQNELKALILRANKINYKNRPPKLPKKISELTLIGYRKRLSNWTSILLHFESERSDQKIIRDNSLLSNHFRS